MTFPVHSGEPEAYISSSRHVHVADPNGIRPNNIIETADPFIVWISFELLAPEVWRLEGFLEFSIRYWAESIGSPPPDYDLGTTSGWTVSGQRRYDRPETERHVPANKLEPGVYRLAAVVTFKVGCPPTPTPARPFPLTAFAEGRAIEVYTP